MPFRKEFIGYFIVIGVVLLIIVSFTFFSLFNQNNSTSPTVSPVPISSTAQVNPSLSPLQVDTSNLEFHPNSSVIAQTIAPSAQQLLDKDTLIGNLIQNLPHVGVSFNLEYDYATNVFTVNLSKNNLTQANEEFDNYLKQNQVENRNWLYNLKTNTL